MAAAEAAAPITMAPPSPTMPDAPAYSATAGPEPAPAAETSPSSRRPSASSAVSAAPSRPSLTRRTSLEEDYFYREVMTVSKKPTEPPPSYESTMKKIRRKEREEAAEAAAKKAAMVTTTTTTSTTATTTTTVTGSIDSTPLPSYKEKKALYKGKGKGKGKGKAPLLPQVTEITPSGAVHAADPDDVLPAYSCDIHMEGIFQRKMEIENATKRAEDRRWGPSYVVLHGTALEIHQCRKDRTWVGRSARAGPGVSPDRPPWMRKAGLEKSYNLSYADVGIAADYVKRRYVIRVRAETDQFLLSCVELETFVQWLDAFFAALSVAAPIDERDFPRDQSIPRLQRIRWYHGRDREAEALRDREREDERARESEREQDDASSSSSGDEAPSSPASRPMSPADAQQTKAPQTVQSVAAAAAAVLAEESGMDAPMDAPADAPGARFGLVPSNASSVSLATESSASTVAGPSTAPLHNLSAQQRAAARAMLSPGTPPAGGSSGNNNADGSGGGGGSGGRFSLRRITSRLAMGPSNAGTVNRGGSSQGWRHEPASGGGRGAMVYRHNAVDAATGKWQPSHRWTKTHDMVYAKLCYATLLFRSPRKSNYIVMRGKQWFVDWATGNMVRVSPPRYGEIETQPGPWQILRTENMRI